MDSTMRVADFKFLSENLTTYRVCAYDQEHDCCMVLSDPRQAGPRYALTDPRIPVLSLAWHLRNNGWDPINTHVVHTVVPSGTERGTFDHRDAPRMKWYYMALTQLGTVLPVAGGSMPSQQPIGYYKCLLNGVQVVADLPAKQYALLYNRSLRGDRIKLEDLLPLNDEPRHALEDEDGVFFVPALGHRNKEKHAR